MLIFPRNSLGGVFLTEELAQILKTAIHRRVISEQGIDFFLENQILIKLEAKPQTPPDVPLPLVATAASRHHLKENQDKV